jgi:cell wall-associated NlpC family hydrolase
MRTGLVITGICIGLLLGGCSSAPPVRPSAANVKPLNKAVSLNNTQLVKSRLYAQLREWRGVRYREGGQSKKGVDCSGFVQLTFRNRLGIRVPRTTELLEDAGRKITASKLRAGDLVFFKTGLFKHHVGIYVEHGKFIHASTSKGVILSDMRNVYWKKSYWKSVRVAI